MAITRSQTETRLASHAAVKALFALAPAADTPDSATESNFGSKWAPISTPRPHTPGGIEETVIVPDQLTPDQRAAWNAASGGARS